MASLIEQDPNFEKTDASRSVVLAGIRETLELVIQRTHGTLTKKQIRSIFFTMSSIFRNTPTLADIIHVPRQRALLLQDALDRTLKKPLEDLVAAAARIKTPSRTMRQQKENCWRERLKKVRQEIDKSSLHVRYVLHEQLLTEARAEHIVRKKELQTVVGQRWKNVIRWNFIQLGKRCSRRLRPLLVGCGRVILVSRVRITLRGSRNARQKRPKELWEKSRRACWPLGIKFVKLIVRRRRRGDASG